MLASDNLVFQFLSVLIWYGIGFLMAGGVKTSIWCDISPLIMAK